jgi:L-Ala-D/L-Glu epimerase
MFAGSGLNIWPFFVSVMHLQLHPFDLRLRHTFTIANDSRDVQPTLIVALQDHSGLTGLGEATSNAYYGVSIAGMTAALERVRHLVETCDWQTAEALWDLTQPHLSDQPFAQCALDEAAHDLVAQRAGLPLYRAWSLDPARNPLTDYTIGLDTTSVMVAKLQEMPWPIYKIKLGRPVTEPDADLAIVRELRRHTDAVFRVDANCGWTAEQTIRYAPVLRDLGVEFIEQPLPADDWAGMKHVFEQSALPIMADESCIVETDVARCAGYFHGVNVKLTKCGGLTPARRMLAEARTLGLSTMVGCMTESSVGIAAIAHLLPLLDFVDMDGAMLIANDPAQGVTLTNGVVQYAARNGTGARLMSATVPG